jgi:hypothetical protein
MFPFSFRESEIWRLIFKFEQPHVLITNNPHNTLPVRRLAWSCKRLPRLPTIMDATSARPPAPPFSAVVVTTLLCTENPVSRLIVVLELTNNKLIVLD